MHLEDLVDALERTVARRKTLPDEVAINIGEPEMLSYKDLQDKIGNLLHGEEWKTYEVPATLAKAGTYGMNLFGDAFIKP